MVKSNNLHQKKDKAGSGDESGASGEGVATEDAENAGDDSCSVRMSDEENATVRKRGREATGMEAVTTVK